MKRISKVSNFKRHSKRIFTAVIGVSVVLIGIVLIPYPGPGWLIVFAGFAILATEFEFAARALEWLKDKYESWLNWLKRQHVSLQITVLAFTGLVVVVTVWLVNGFGILNGLLQLNQTWLISPLFR
jgi:uncharacterized protein (TIGR02611 family)